MWAALEGGALVMVKGDSALELKHFIDPRFLPFFASSICLHFIGNHDGIMLFYVPFVYDFKYVLTIALAIYLVYILIEKAIVQLLRESNTVSSSATLRSIAGPLNGRIYPFNDRIKIGRDSKECNVVLPVDTRGVSRRHCTVELRASLK